MTERAREFVDLFVKHSIHADGQLHPANGNAVVDELVRRCLQTASEQAISQAEIDAAFPDLAEHFRLMIDIMNAGAANR